LTALVMAAAELALPALVGGAVDAVLDSRSAGIWVVICGVLIGVLVACDALDDFAAGAATARSTARLRHGLTAHLLALGSEPVRRLPAGRSRPGSSGTPRRQGVSHLMSCAASLTSCRRSAASSRWHSSTRGCA
jgi:ATP-binding cassette subfamily B protein